MPLTENDNVGPGRIQTVTGPIQPDLLGITLPHEHLYISQWHLADRYDYAGQVDDDDLLHDEVIAFKERGGQSIVDCTVPDIGRRPEKLRTMSERTGLNFIMGCGWYRQNYYRPEDQVDRRPVEALADQLIDEIVNGVGRSGIRPGIIGEVGTEKAWVSAQEERVHRAAARAQRATGLALTTHSIGRPVGLLELDIFEDEGVDLSRVVVGHCDHVFSLSLDYHLALLKRGAYVEFDTLGSKSEGLEERALQVLLELLHRGYAERVLLSQDVCKAPQLRCLGGNGFTYIFDTYLSRLRGSGVTDDLIRIMTVDNPRRVLTIAG
jgi:predicted metal-dependent phosphotriesterase family hydrolase